MTGDKTACGIQMGLPLYCFALEVAKTGSRLVHKLILRQCDRRNHGPFKSNVLVRWFLIYIVTSLNNDTTSTADNITVNLV